MSGLDWLAAAAAEREAAGLHRSPVVRAVPDDGELDLSSNDYLGLARRPEVVRAAADAALTWGGGSTGSRLVSGTTAPHLALERDLADFLGAEAALVFSSGYTANIGAIAALAGRGDVIVSDGGSHASLIDGCRLSRADVVVTPRGDVAAVDAALAGAVAEMKLAESTVGQRRRLLVVTDSVYSADGTAAPLAELHAAARRHGAVLLADEAHALGVRGPGGRGLAAEAGIAGEPDLVQTVTLSKSLGAQGGAVAGVALLRDHLIDTARSFIFDTGLAPAAVAAAHAALGVLRREPGLAAAVCARARELAAAIGAPEPASAVVSLVLGDPERALAAAARCRAEGVVVGCFRPPSVPVGTSRLRLTARADLTAADVERAAAVVLAAAGVPA